MARDRRHDLITLLTNALFPIFAGLALGYIAGIRKVVDNLNVKSLVTFLMSFALPCSLFAAIAHTPNKELVGHARLAVVILAVYLITFAIAWFAAVTLDKNSIADGAVLALTLAFPNATAVGLPLLQSAYGPHALIACAIGIAIGAISISPITLALLESTTSGQHASLASRIGTAAYKAIKRPVVWAPILGVVAAFAGLTLPPYIDRTLGIFAAATAGVALFLTGLVVSAQRFTLDLRVCLAVLLKNIIQPALCLGLAMLAHLPVDQTRSVVLIAAIPCGFFGIIFGKGFNATPRTASSSLIASYVAGIFTLAGWMIYLSHLT
jgi:malonate transporter